MLTLRTQRLELIAATAALMRREIRSTKELADALRCAEPAHWPPPLNDEASQQWFVDFLKERPDAAGWLLWYMVKADSRELIGNAGFKGNPADGVCEIGYSLLPAYQRQGFATEAVRALIEWAFSHPEVESVIAQTFPDMAESIGVMERCGMHYAGGGTEDGQRTVRYELLRTPADD